jgi:hypothetical protein
VGLLNKGQLIRCDTPANLRAQLAPRCFRAEADNLREARKRLQLTDGVLGAVPAGAALHVYLKEGATVAAIEQAAAPVRLLPLEPALEDVFIALIQSEALHEAA